MVRDDVKADAPEVDGWAVWRTSDRAKTWAVVGAYASREEAEAIVEQLADEEAGEECGFATIRGNRTPYDVMREGRERERQEAARRRRIVNEWWRQLYAGEISFLDD
jgi:hypothetical protein